MLNDGFPDDARQEDNRLSTPVLIVIWSQRECRLRWRAVVWTKNLPNGSGANIEVCRLRRLERQWFIQQELHSRSQAQLGL